MLHVITALVHNGAFLLVDAINPDGSIVPEVYHGLMKNIYAKTMPYEKYINENFYHNASIWFATHAKYDPYENCDNMMDKKIHPDLYMEGPVAAASILRENNIPFEVIGTKNIAGETADVMILSHVAAIREEEMDLIEAYVNRGGNLYVSGPVGNPRLEKLIGIEITGRTEHKFTYMRPTEAGMDIFEGFGSLAPLTVPMAQMMAKITDEEGLTVLATRTLPYTLTDTEDFAAIHSNPPGIYTDEPCMILKDTGKGKIIWSASPIEMSRPYMSRQVFSRIIKSLVKEPAYVSNAPKFVEVIGWEKDGEDYFAIINEQEESPVVPMHDIYIDVKKPDKKAVLLPDETELKTEVIGDTLRIHLPKVEIFQMIKLV